MAGNYTYTGQAAGSLKLQKYNNFRGVDFTDDNVSESRSPDSLNMWKNYKTLGKMIETRPDIELQLQLDNTIYGLFFYTINTVDHWIIHYGVKLIDYNPSTQATTVLKASGMNPNKSVAFIYNNILFIKDGINYLEYNGTAISNVTGTVPLTTIGRKPDGGGTQYQDINLLSNYRKNSFMGDGTSTIYHLDSDAIDSVSEVKVNGSVIAPSGYTVSTTNGTVTFNTAPSEAVSDDNVVITYSKSISGNANKILKCTLACMFDNRIFFSGNQDYPNALFWCNYNDPRYIGDLNYSLEGTDTAKVKALIPSNNALWVCKEPSQANTTIFYHTPIEIYDNRLEDTVKTYPSVHSSISIGCVATGINFNDDITFFSDRGMEGITGDITTEQVLGHRSTLVDRKLLSESNYKNMTLQEWDGYLLVLIDNKAYLADSRQIVANVNHNEYEWFYWEFSKDINVAAENQGTLYLCTKVKNGASYIYTLTNNNTNRTVSAHWTTKMDDYGYPQMLKTTNKRGFKCDVAGTTITISSKLDNGTFETLGTYTNTKGYIVAKLKKKKWNKIQLKFSSTSYFGIYGVALESYIGGYVKRS